MNNYSVDTVRLAIPVKKAWIERVEKNFEGKDRWHWCRYNPARSEIWLASVSAEIAPKSWHKTLYVSLRDHSDMGKSLITEFSIPKAITGNNVGLLPWWIKHLQQLGGALEQYLLTLADPADEMNCPVLGEFESWRLLRLDLAWAWKFPTQLQAEGVLEGLKRARFRWRKPTLYATGIHYPSSTAPCKFYLKLPEFRKHDLRKLANDPAIDQNLIPAVLGQASGTLRFECTLRGRALREHGLLNIGDVYSVQLGDVLQSFLERCTSLDGLYLSEAAMAGILLERFSRAKAGRLLDFCRVLAKEGEAFALARYGAGAYYRNRRAIADLTDELQQPDEALSSSNEDQTFRFPLDDFNHDLRPIQLFVSVDSPLTYV